MEASLKLGNGDWGVKNDSLLAYDDFGGKFRPLPFDFTRASSATVVNKQGLIETVQSGIPRIDFSNDANGALLLEPQSTNLAPYSEDFSQWTLYNIDAPIANQGISPNGNNEATKITTSTSKVKSVVYQPSTISGNITRSVFAKKGSADFMFFDVPSSNAGAWFNLSNGELGTINSGTSTIEDYGNGWYRCSCTANWTSSTFSIGLSDADNSTAISGGKGILIWGAQTEAQSFPTSYIPTQGAISTRLRDIATNSGNASLINSESGVLYAEFSLLSQDYVSERNIALQGQGQNCRIRFLIDGTLRWTLIGNNTTIARSLTITNTNINKVAIRYSSTSASIWINGLLADTSLNGMTYTALDEITMNGFYSKTKALAVYKTALTDAQLIALTTI